MDPTVNISANPAEIIWEGRIEPVSTKYAYSGLILTVVFFQILDKIVSGTAYPKAVQTSDFWKWKNLYISWIHAVIVGLWDISCFVLYPEMFQDLVAYHNMHIYSMVCFTSGYFLHDFVDIVRNRMSFKMWEVLVHHIAVASIFFYNVLESRCLAYNCIALTVEINSAFLHARKLLQMCHMSYDHILYRCVKWANLITFFLFRFGALVAIFYGMWIWSHRVSLEYFGLLSFSMFIMSGINCVLFKRLLKSDVFRKEPSYHAKSSKNGVAVVTNNNGQQPYTNGAVVTNNNTQENKPQHDKAH